MIPLSGNRRSRQNRLTRKSRAVRQSDRRCLPQNHPLDHSLNHRGGSRALPNRRNVRHRPGRMRRNRPAKCPRQERLCQTQTHPVRSRRQAGLPSTDELFGYREYPVTVTVSGHGDSERVTVIATGAGLPGSGFTVAGAGVSRQFRIPTSGKGPRAVAGGDRDVLWSLRTHAGCGCELNRLPDHGLPGRG